MKRASSILVLFVLLAFGVSLAVPAEDVAETGYDESETLPYENNPPVSIVVPLRAARTTLAPLRFLPSKLGDPSLCTLAGFRDTDVHRSADARILLAQLCTLLC
jgi:hypothetical protein